MYDNHTHLDGVTMVSIDNWVVETRLWDEIRAVEVVYSPPCAVIWHRRMDAVKIF